VFYKKKTLYCIDTFLTWDLFEIKFKILVVYNDFFVKKNKSALFFHMVVMYIYIYLNHFIVILILIKEIK